MADNEDLTLSFALQQLAFILERRADQFLLEQLGLSFAQYKLIKLIQLNPQAKQRQIADSLFQTEAGISRQINYLIKKGLLVRRSSKLDNRERYHELTSQAKQLVGAADQILQREYSEVWSDLSKNKQDLLEIILKLIAKQPSLYKTSNYRHIWEKVI